MQSVPSVRVRSLNAHSIRPDSQFVLYWMTAYRRTRFNFALQRAVDWSEELGKPLVILEAVRTNYRWACDRFHQFIIDGMIDNAKSIAKTNASYLSYVEPASGDGSDLVRTLGQHACLIVSDDYPCFFHPTMYDRIARKWATAVELVDSNGLMPMRATDRIFTVAHSYRRFMQKEIPSHLNAFPEEEPLKRLKVKKLQSLPANVRASWPALVEGANTAKRTPIDLAELPIDHSVKPTGDPGGEVEAGKVLERFLTKRLADYAEARNEPEQDGSSWLSPYLHFGAISAHEVFQKLTSKIGWDCSRLAKPNGKMNGYWNMGENVEAFVDQLLTWREIGFNMCCHEKNFDRYESLPEWAQVTLEEHAKDPREFVYTQQEFDQAETHDDLWNAAQRQLVREGRIHNYLRMLWGKKILHWTASPQEALKVMIHLNNKYALDGRDPNSYSGIFWVLGRYDRAWGPERSIFGKIRYMTSDSTRSKFHVKKYIQKYS